MTKQVYTSMPGIQEVYLGDNQLETIEEGIENWQELEVLELRNNRAIKELP